MKLSTVLCVVLLAGVSHAVPISRSAGDDYTFTMIVISNTIETCHLKNPAGVILDFTPGATSQPGDRYELQPSGTMPSCSIKVKNLQETDTGLWEVSFSTPTGTGNSQSFELVVTGTSGTLATSVTRDAGEDYTFTMIVISDTIETCHLKNPFGVTLAFTPGATSQHGDRYVLQPSGTTPSCSIKVKNLQETDTGLWEVSFLTPTGTGNSQRFKLVVTESQDDEDVDDDDDLIWLNTIEFPTRTNQVIDISLPKTSHEEECSIRLPKGDSYRASEVNIDGVTVYNSSNYVSCRITIGPMTESLLGDWAVCGTYTENNEKHKRCQLAKIFWNNVNNPNTEWDTKTQEQFDHPVHLKYTLTPVVIGSGDIVSCHVVTPDGEDLVIDHDSKYPSITANNLAHSTCGIAIGPIDWSMLGNWTIYGVFRNSVMGLNDVRLPISMFLYDEKYPYSQAYNVTVLDRVNRVVNLGSTLILQVDVNAGQVDNCYFTTPAGNIYNKYDSISWPGASFVEEDADTSIACRVAIGPITEKMLGYWTITGKFGNNGIFTERQQTFRIIQEDPKNPIEEDRTISYLNPQTLETKIGATHRLIINSDVFTNAESCHIRTPNGWQYTIMEGFHLKGVEVIQQSGVECGVIVNVVSEDVIGEWILIARSNRHLEPIERRLPFTIYVEEFVEALPNEITVIEGNDLYVRLKYRTDQYETCQLIDPFGNKYLNAQRDPLYIETCGFIMKNVQTLDNGTWVITYGDKIVYKAEIVVTVNPGNTETESYTTTLNLVRDRSIKTTVGPENAVYCKLEDPQGFAVFDGFGRCNLTLDKVGVEHNGVWKMFVGAPGRVHTDEYQLTVNVRESESKAVVNTQVTQDKPIITISCFVQTEAEVQACKFRDPQGKILLATSGVSEDRYTFHGTNVSYESEVTTRECGIRITNPLVTDLGMWRCAIDTSEETFYGHMAVLCTYALLKPEVAAAVQQEPILKSDRSLVNVVEEEPATMSCSVEATIRYCYFRSSNGTTFTVTPGMSSSSMEYVGNGFDAGECGLKFHGLYASDSGRWSCHVGIVGNHEEQRAQFQLNVNERMRVNHYNTHGNIMTVEGFVYDGRALEYCRFVRIDGFGFTTDNVPSQYTNTSILANGLCQFTARNPTILDVHPWTIVAKIRGQDVEISKDTMEAILIEPSSTPAPEPDNNEHGVPNVPTGSTGFSVFLYVFLCVLLVSVLLGVWIGPKRHREWTYRRASAFRSSFRKQQLPMPETMPNHTNA